MIASHLGLEDFVIVFFCFVCFYLQEKKSDLQEKKSDNE